MATRAELEAKRREASLRGTRRDGGLEDTNMGFELSDFKGLGVEGVQGSRLLKRIVHGFPPW